MVSYKSKYEKYKKKYLKLIGGMQDYIPLIHTDNRNIAALVMHSMPTVDGELVNRDNIDYYSGAIHPKEYNEMNKQFQTSEQIIKQWKQQTGKNIYLQYFSPPGYKCDGHGVEVDEQDMPVYRSKTLIGKIAKVLRTHGGPINFFTTDQYRAVLHPLDIRTNSFKPQPEFEYDVDNPEQDIVLTPIHHEEVRPYPAWSGNLNMYLIPRSSQTDDSYKTDDYIYSTTEVLDEDDDEAIQENLHWRTFYLSQMISKLIITIEEHHPEDYYQDILVLMLVCRGNANYTQ